MIPQLYCLVVLELRNLKSKFRPGRAPSGDLERLRLCLPLFQKPFASPGSWSLLLPIANSPSSADSSVLTVLLGLHEDPEPLDSLLHSAPPALLYEVTYLQVSETKSWASCRREALCSPERLPIWELTLEAKGCLGKNNPTR